MSLAGAFLVELRPDEALVGLRHTSDMGPDLPAQWSERRDAESTVIEPGAEWNLVLVIDSHSDAVATADAARIRYEDADGNVFTQDTLTAMLVSQKPCDEALAEGHD
jgi:hypothetical protein